MLLADLHFGKVLPFLNMELGQDNLVGTYIENPALFLDRLLLDIFLDGLLLLRLGVLVGRAVNVHFNDWNRPGTQSQGLLIMPWYVLPLEQLDFELLQPFVGLERSDLAVLFRAALLTIDVKVIAKVNLHPVGPVEDLEQLPLVVGFLGDIHGVGDHLEHVDMLDLPVVLGEELINEVPDLVRYLLEVHAIDDLLGGAVEQGEGELRVVQVAHELDDNEALESRSLRRLLIALAFNHEAALIDRGSKHYLEIVGESDRLLILLVTDAALLDQLLLVDVNNKHQRKGQGLGVRNIGATLELDELEVVDEDGVLECLQ